MSSATVASPKSSDCGLTDVSVSLQRVMESTVVAEGDSTRKVSTDKLRSRGELPTVITCDPIVMCNSILLDRTL